MMEYGQLAAALGLSHSTFHFLVCFLATVPICWLHRFVPTVLGRHLYAFLSGTVLCYVTFGFPVYHLFIPCITGYSAMLLYRQRAGLITFFASFAILIYCHVKYMSGDAWKQGNIDFTGAMMIVTLKVISAAVNYQDGLLPEKNLRETQKHNRITRLPNPLEYLAYVFYCGNIMSGPPFEIVDYLAYSERTREWGSDKPKASPYPAAARALLQGAIAMAIYQYLTPRAPLEFFSTPAYYKYSLLQKLAYQYLVAITTRWKYYFIWSVAEVALILSGVGFSGWEDGKPTWSHAKNVDILGVELADSGVKLPHYWNIRVGNWLRLYVYDRVTPPGKKPGLRVLMATQITSAVWHGLYPGYLLFFANSALMIDGSKVIHKYILFITEKFPWAKPAASVFGWLCGSLANNCGCIGFVLLSFKDSIAAYRSVYFAGTLVPLFFVILGRIFPPPRAKQRTAKGAKAADKKEL